VVLGQQRFCPLRAASRSWPLAAGEELGLFTLVVPPAWSWATKAPVLSGSAVYVGQAAYQLQEGQLLLDEYIITHGRAICRSACWREARTA